MEPGCSISTITGSDKRDAFSAQSGGEPHRYFVSERVLGPRHRASPLIDNTLPGAKKISLAAAAPWPNPRSIADLVIGRMLDLPRPYRGRNTRAARAGARNLHHLRSRHAVLRLLNSTPRTATHWLSNLQVDRGSDGEEPGEART
jgi:hypothetical protein